MKALEISSYAMLKKAGIKFNGQFKEESNMKISIPIGTRGKATEFRDSYKRDFFKQLQFYNDQLCKQWQLF